jgi:hypothetical protein
MSRTYKYNHSRLQYVNNKRKEGQNLILMFTMYLLEINLIRYNRKWSVLLRRSAIVTEYLHNVDYDQTGLKFNTSEQY